MNFFVITSGLNFLSHGLLIYHYPKRVMMNWVSLSSHLNDVHLKARKFLWIANYTIFIKMSLPLRGTKQNDHDPEYA